MPPVPSQKLLVQVQRFKNHALGTTRVNQVRRRQIKNAHPPISRGTGATGTIGTAFHLVFRSLRLTALVSNGFMPITSSMKLGPRTLLMCCPPNPRLPDVADWTYTGEVITL